MSDKLYVNLISNKHFWSWTPCILPEMLDEAVASFYQMWSDGRNLRYEQKRIQTEYCACKDKKMRKVIDLYLMPLQSLQLLAIL